MDSLKAPVHSRSFSKTLEYLISHIPPDDTHNGRSSLVRLQRHNRIMVERVLRAIGGVEVEILFVDLLCSDPPTGLN
jgi:hypothetical protein